MMVHFTGSLQIYKIPLLILPGRHQNRKVTQPVFKGLVFAAKKFLLVSITF